MLLYLAEGLFQEMILKKSFPNKAKPVSAESSNSDCMINELTAPLSRSLNQLFEDLIICLAFFQSQYITIGNTLSCGNGLNLINSVSI